VGGRFSFKFCRGTVALELNLHKESLSMNTDVMVAQDLAAFARRLFSIGAVKIDTKVGFKMKLHEKKPDAPLSPYYFNLRIRENKNGPLTYGEVEATARLCYQYLQRAGVEFDGICGVPHAGEPFTKALQEIFYLHESRMVPVITLDKEEAGSNRKIGTVTKVQDLPRGSKVLLLDDLITKAGSKLEAVAQLEHAGFAVTDCLVFLDREEGGAEGLLTHGVRLHAVTTLTELLELYERDGTVTPAEALVIRDYMATQ
jgi:orotate phosphoribosyltransferase